MSVYIYLSALISRTAGWILIFFYMNTMDPEEHMDCMDFEKWTGNY